MSKNTSLEKSLKKVVILLGLLIISPLILSISFKALRIFTTSPKIILAYSLLIAGILLTLYTVYFGFKTFKSILDSLFKD